MKFLRQTDNEYQVKEYVMESVYSKTDRQQGGKT
jgi:hypothetical protein